MAWEIVYPIGALILLAGIVWGLVQSHRRSRHMKQVTDVAARELYRHPERYERETHDRLAEIAECEQQREKDEPRGA